MKNILKVTVFSSALLSFFAQSMQSTPSAQPAIPQSNKSIKLYRAIHSGNYPEVRSIIESEKKENRLIPGNLERPNRPLLEQIYNNHVVALVKHNYTDDKKLELDGANRLAIINYLIEQGYQVNNPNHKDQGALTALVSGIIASKISGENSYTEIFLIPATNLYIKAEVSLEQLLNAQNKLKQANCLSEIPCASTDCPFCMEYGNWWKKNIAPKIEAQLKQ